MKNTLLYSLSIFFLVACGSAQKESNENESSALQEGDAKAETVLTGNYGEKIDETGAISTTEMLALLEDADSISLKVQTKILSTCAMKGCWMNVALSDEDQMRVTFKDYGFFVPKSGVEDKNTIVEGYVKKVTTDVETLRHFAEDAGKSPEEIESITEPKREITFVASGVIIQN
ncbi:DUF4920 domain-containing protein [Fulvivirga sp. M361]|uniref:DUF4920 domain-containing protein n=1 Tax=Fulvivirga sp. M361 TaxID=2594266 RepID=UPI00117AD9E5|nr:DUF4920 domain-containing protein [Fulvivirga sp. M361]TRX50202.1 DUF4920 domain-containing protein [Fulvivirga sp. M361]